VPFSRLYESTTYGTQVNSDKHVAQGTSMTTNTEALRLALDALVSCVPLDYSAGHVIHPSFDDKAVAKATDAVLAALAQPQPAPGPEDMRDAFEHWTATQCSDCTNYTIWKAACVWMAAQPAPAAQPVAWQPIETAPKDGQLLLLHGLAAGEISGISKTPAFDIGSYCGPGGDYSGFEWSSFCGDAYAVWLNPTHWMPLPTQPQADQA